MSDIRKRREEIAREIEARLTAITEKCKQISATLEEMEDELLDIYVALVKPPPFQPKK